MSSTSSKAFVFITLFILILTTFLLLKSNKVSSEPSPAVLSYEADKQFININVKGGYYPTYVAADANKDTILRLTTNNTFDCSSAFMIPSLAIKKSLPPTAVTEIPLGVQAAGTKLLGTCSMGMYSFQMEFR